MFSLYRRLPIALVFALLITPRLNAELILSLDARQPGSNTSTQWEDLSGKNSPLEAAFDAGLGSSSNPVYNPSGGPQNGGPETFYGPVFEFGGGGQVHWFETQGADHEKFNFSAPQCVGTPASCTADPNGAMTVVAYFANETFGDNTPFYSKGEGTSSHHEITVLRNGINDQAVMDIGYNNNPGDRAMAQALATDDPIKMDLWVFHFDGSGWGGNFEIYHDGSTSNIASGLSGQDQMSQGAYDASLNLNPLHIGSRIGLPSIDKQFFGDIQFIEVYSGSTIDNELGTGLSPSAYSQLRFNNLASIITGSAGCTPSVSGDYNCSTAVEGTDFLLWQQTLGDSVPSGTDADGSGNGTVGPEDLVIWDGAYGNTTLAVSGTAVPEPASVVMVLVGLLAIPLRNEHRSHRF